MKTNSALPIQWMNYFLMVLLAFMPLVYNDSGVDPNLIPRLALMSLYVLTVSIYLFVRHKNLQTNYHVLVLMPFALIAEACWYSVLNATNQTEAVFVTTYFLYDNRMIQFKYVVYVMATACFVSILLVLKDVYLLNKLHIIIWESDNVYKITATFGQKNLLSSYLLFTMSFLAIAIKNQTKTNGYRLSPTKYGFSPGIYYLLVQTDEGYTYLKY